MMATLLTLALPWFAAAALLLALAAAASILWARSLFSASIGMAALCACAASALLAMGQGEGALALALLGAGMAPLLLLGGVLLSSRAVQPRARGTPWLSILAAGAAAAAIVSAAPGLREAAQIPAPPDDLPLPLVAIVFVAVAACVALLGFGERGLLTGARGSREE